MIAARVFGLERTQLMSLVDASVGFVFATNSKELCWLKREVGMRLNRLQLGLQMSYQKQQQGNRDK